MDREAQRTIADAWFVASLFSVVFAPALIHALGLWSRFAWLGPLASRGRGVAWGDAGFDWALPALIVAFSALALRLASERGALWRGAASFVALLAFIVGAAVGGAWDLVAIALAAGALCARRARGGFDLVLGLIIVWHTWGALAALLRGS